MSHLYKITPLEKKSVQYIIEAFKKLDSGETITFTVTEYYRWGTGYREIDNPVNGTDIATCLPMVGHGCELEELEATFFEFSDNFPDDMKEDVQKFWDEGDEEGYWGSAWLFNGGHMWEIENDYVNILGPFSVITIDEDTGDVV